MVKVSVGRCMVLDVWYMYTGWPINKPLPNYQQIVLNRIKVCQLDWIS